MYKKLQLITLTTALIASSTMAANTDTIVTSNSDLPIFLRLDAGIAIPSGNDKDSPITNAKLKQSSSPTLGLTVGYKISDDLSATFEIAGMNFEGSVDNDTSVSEDANNFLAQKLISDSFNTGLEKTKKDRSNRITSFLKKVNINPEYQDKNLDDKLTSYYNNGASNDQINDMLQKTMPYIKNNISTKTRESLFIITAMPGINFDVFKNDSLSLNVGASAGVAIKNLESVTEATITWKDNTKSTYTFTDKSRTYTPAFGANVGAKMQAADNLTLSINYGFKHLGKVKRAASLDRSQHKSYTQNVHLVTAGLSYSF